MSIVVNWPRPFLTPKDPSVRLNVKDPLYAKKQLSEHAEAHRRNGLVLRIVLSFGAALRVLVLCTRLVKRLLRLEVCTLRVCVVKALCIEC